MSKFKIIASDLDGTLLNSEHALSAENSRAISDLNKRGVQFVPFTGRTFSEVPSAVREHPDVRYVCYSNGATVLDKVTGDKIEYVIPSGKLNQLMSVLEKYEVHYAVRYGGNCYCDDDQMNERAFAYYNLTSDHVDCIKRYSKPVRDFRDFARSLDGVEVVAVFFRSLADVAKCRAEGLALDEIGVAGVDPYNLEFFNAQAGKGNSLRALASKLGVPMSAVIAMGDSDNDISMVKVAGLGIATSNANDSLKSVADEIICSNDEHVVEYALNHFVK